MRWRKIKGMSMYSPEPTKLVAIGKRNHRKKRKFLKPKPVYLSSHVSEVGIFGKKAVRHAKEAVESAKLYAARHPKKPKKNLYSLK